MDRFVRFDKSYDVDLLKRDMQVALSANGHVHSNRTWRHGEGWNTVALYSVDGRTDPDALRWAGWDANYQPTPILEQTPYFRQIIDEFQCPVFRVRLSNLAAGQAINPHRDRGDCWAVGKVRLHIPVVTNPDVWFFVDDQRAVMNEGELWYADVAPLHMVFNRGTEDRVHLMLDLGVNDWLRDMFPDETLSERLYNLGYRTWYLGKERLYELRERAGLTGLRDKARSLKKMVGG
jgi:hypothetical protein